MRCSCPKCNSAIELDIREIPADGSFNKCPECGTGFLLRKESFACRALRKGDNLTCAECGSQLGPAIFCQNCHALYPDYHATETSSAAKKQFGRILATLSAINKIGASKGSKPSHHEYKPSADTKSAAPAAKKGGGQQTAFILTCLILLVALGAGGFFYYQNKKDNEYGEKYVRAIFVIKSAADMNKNLSAKIVSDWKAAATPQAPKLAAGEQKSLNSAMKDVDLVMQELPDAPEKFIASREALGTYLDNYKKMQSLNSSPSGTADSFAEAATKLDGEFRKSGTAMKSGFPQKLAEAFAEGKKKYKPLNDI